MNYGKGAIVLAIVTTGAAVLKMLVQARTAREAAADKLKADEALAKIKRDVDERAARQAREAAERAAERDQKEALIASLQAATKETLDVLRDQIKSQKESSEKSFELQDRNTQAIGKLVESVASLAQDSRTMTGKISELTGGAGCRASSH